ncbi:outer membrane protein [Chryseobacterium sediminis]|uniref:Outer membrane protein n=1 Tax=Chryseobacterium sediminis TaxID=1679494 RepID=A0ABR6PXG8_9FLAO|nr:OmpH family outer membrane protein [Chryseobacterium sediminis]MBB6330390.1 outer membrane protein [Chryseobacterium sediminis]
MKNFKSIFTLILFSVFSLNSAQKTGYVDFQYILEKMPPYKNAEARLNAQIDTWQSELQNLQSVYEKKKSAFENEKILLTEEQLKFREKEITELDKNIKLITMQRFGTNGEITMLRKNLIIPFEDQIYNAITLMAEKNGLATVYNKDHNVLYLQKRFDYTEKVLGILLAQSSVTDKNNKN